MAPFLVAVEPIAPSHFEPRQNICSTIYVNGINIATVVAANVFALSARKFFEVLE